MIKLRAKVAPDGHTVPWFPPCGESQIEQVQRTQNRSLPYPEAKQQTTPNKSLDHAHHIAKKHGMG